MNTARNNNYLKSRKRRDKQYGYIIFEWEIQ